jgi:hypothetical protein
LCTGAAALQFGASMGWGCGMHVEVVPAGYQIW